MIDNHCPVLEAELMYSFRFSNKNALLYIWVRPSISLNLLNRLAEVLTIFFLPEQPYSVSQGKGQKGGININAYQHY